MKVKEAVALLLQQDQEKELMIQQGMEYDYVRVNSVRVVELSIIDDDIIDDDIIEAVCIEYE